LGHLLNLVNGSGAGIAENLFQVTGTIAIGFLLVSLYCLQLLLSILLFSQRHSRKNSIKIENGREIMDMENVISEWLRCPVCGNKTRLRLRADREAPVRVFFCLLWKANLTFSCNHVYLRNGKLTFHT
jgi:hypothetical protein